MTYLNVYLLVVGPDASPRIVGSIGNHSGAIGSRCCEHGHDNPQDAARHTGQRVADLLLADYQHAAGIPGTTAHELATTGAVGG